MMWADSHTGCWSTLLRKRTVLLEAAVLTEGAGALLEGVRSALQLSYVPFQLPNVLIQDPGLLLGTGKLFPVLGEQYLLR